MREKATAPFAVITGASSGIGFALAHALARRGWQVTGVCRSALRARHCTELLRARTGNPHISFITADLSLMREVEVLGDKLAAQLPRLDLLINNAGAIYTKRQETAEGLERTLALNVLAPFVLTPLLVPALAAAPHGRIINMASAAHFGASLDLDDLEMAKGRYNGWLQYQRTKLMNILYTRELALYLPENVSVAAVHPGFVRTHFGRDNPRLWRWAMRLLMLTALSPERAADGVLRAALSPDPQEGRGAYYDRGVLKAPSPAAQDGSLAAQLWQVTAALLAAKSSA